MENLEKGEREMQLEEGTFRFNIAHGLSQINQII